MKRFLQGLAAAVVLMVFWAAPAADAKGRRLQASDTIQIRVLNQPEFDNQARIAPDGTVSLPYLGRVKVSGLTEDNLALRYKNALRQQDVVKDAQVIVSTTGYGTQVTVAGAVRTPGEQILDRPTSLSEALSRAGGPSQSAGTIVLRRGGKIFRYDQVAVLAGGGPHANPFVQNGDQIYVEEAPVFYLYGYVNRPGAYPLVRALTVQQALASGGGLAELGSEWRIHIKRTRGGQVEMIPADLDQRVLPNDTIVVKERIF